MQIQILKQLAGVLRSPNLGRHFRRLTIFDAFRSPTVSKEVPPSLAQTLVWASQESVEGLLADLHTAMDGLTDVQAEALRDRFGPNAVQQEKPLPWWRHLWHCYQNPFNLLLTLLAAISYYTEDMKATVVISLMVTLSVVIRFIQEFRSNKAADKLKEMVSNTATVLRRDLSEEAAPCLTSITASISRPNPPIGGNCPSGNWCLGTWYCSPPGT